MSITGSFKNVIPLSQDSKKRDAKLPTYPDNNLPHQSVQLI